MKSLKKIVLILAILLLVLFSYITNTFSNMIIHPSWHAPGLDSHCSASQMEYAKVVCIDNPESAIKEKFETVKIDTADKRFVEGWHFPNGKNDKIVIFIHGAGVDRRNGYKLVPFLLKAGFGVYLFDSLNHGRSFNNGKGVSYGMNESAAFPAVIDWAKSKYKKVYLISTSAGIGTVAFSRDKWKGKVEAMVIENPYISLKRIVLQDEIAKSIPSWYLDIVLYVTGWKGGFDVNATNTEKALADFPDIPVVVMHGTADKTIFFEQGKEFYQNLNVKNKKFFIAKDTDHCRVWDKYPKEFESLTLQLFGGQ